MIFKIKLIVVQMIVGIFPYFSFVSVHFYILSSSQYPVKTGSAAIPRLYDR